MNGGKKLEPNLKPNLLVLEQADEVCSTFQYAGFVRANSSSRPTIDTSIGPKDRNDIADNAVTSSDVVNVQFPFLRDIADAATLSFAELPYPVLFGATVKTITPTDKGFLVEFMKNGVLYTVIFATGYEKDFTPAGFVEEAQAKKALEKDRGFYGNSYLRSSGRGKLYTNGSASPTTSADDDNENSIALFNLSLKANALGKELAQKRVRSQNNFGPTLDDYQLDSEYFATLSPILNSIRLKGNTLSIIAPDEVVSARANIRADLPNFLGVFFTEFSTLLQSRSLDVQKRMHFSVYRKKTTLNIVGENVPTDIMLELQPALALTPGLLSALFDELSENRSILVDIVFKESSCRKSFNSDDQ